MAETPPLPSREAVQASMDDEFGDLALVYRIADEWITGRLVDREAIDYEAVARKMYERATTQWPSDWLRADQDFWIGGVKVVVDAAIGEAMQNVFRRDG